MEYVIIGACIVVAIAGGIVLYVKNKRTKNELGNTAVVVSKTSSSKLQASEVANDPVIQIGILPADAISDETKLVEITDSKVLAHINNLVPGLAQAGNAANNATQAVKASNIDDRGTFTELKKSVNKTKAENFFRLVFKDDYVPLRLPIYSENYLRDFIFSGGKDPYLNVIEVEQTSAYTPDDAREYNKPNNSIQDLVRKHVTAS